MAEPRNGSNIFQRHYVFYGNVCICVYNYNMNSGDIIKRLRCDGWYEVARRGSHVQFKHAVKKGRVTVPHPKKDLPTGTVKSIEKQARIKLI